MTEQMARDLASALSRTIVQCLNNSSAIAGTSGINMTAGLSPHDQAPRPAAGQQDPAVAGPSTASSPSTSGGRNQVRK